MDANNLYLAGLEPRFCQINGRLGEFEVVFHLVGLDSFQVLLQPRQVLATGGLFHEVVVVVCSGRRRERLGDGQAGRRTGSGEGWRWRRRRRRSRIPPEVLGGRCPLQTRGGAGPRRGVGGVPVPVAVAVAAVSNGPKGKRGQNDFGRGSLHGHFLRLFLLHPRATDLVAQDQIGVALGHKSHTILGPHTL